MTDNEKALHLTSMEIDTIGEIGNICMSSAATAMHDILQKKVTITTPSVSITNTKELAETYTIPYVVVDVSYTKGVIGNNLLIIKVSDVEVITSIMMGEEEAKITGELSELQISAIGEIMNQMIGTSATSMSTLTKTEISISPPIVNVINIADDKEKLPFHNDPIISTKFKLIIEDLLDTEIVLLMPYEFGKHLIQGFLSSQNMGDAQEEQAAPPSNPEKAKKAQRQANVKSVTLQSFDEPADTKITADNIDLLLDVPLTVSVELGRTKRYLKDVLEMGIGSIVSLDKPAGDLVDVLVNGKLIARGEVVVIDDNFGVRITDIIGAENKKWPLQTI